MSDNNRPEVLDSEEENEIRLRRQFGRRLVELRRRRNWSQLELSRRVGVRRCRLGKWESGANEPPLAMVVALCRELGVTPNELLGEHGTELLSPAQRELLSEAAQTLLSFISLPKRGTGRKRG